MKLICIILLLIGVEIPSMYAQTFDKLWKQVEQAEKDNLFPAAIKLTDEIYRKGKLEKNSPQMLKAYMWRMYYIRGECPDSVNVVLKEMEHWAQQTDNPVECAVLHSFMASTYARQTVPNYWELRLQTHETDTLSTDICKWTVDMLVNQVIVHIQESLVNLPALLRTSSLDYVPLVSPNTSGKSFCRNMCYLLTSCAIDVLEQIYESDSRKQKKERIVQAMGDVYKNVLSACRLYGYKEDYILISLEYLQWKYSRLYNTSFNRKAKSVNDFTQEAYLAELDRLIADYKSYDICAEVFLEKANYLMEHGDRRAMALQLCNEAIGLYPGYFRINALKNIRESIQAPTLHAFWDNVAYPGEKMNVQISFKNLEGITLRLFQEKKMIFEQHYSLSHSKDYAERDTTLVFHVPNIGSYVMKLVPDIRTDREVEASINVTRMKILARQLSKDQCEVAVLDFQTGHPVSNAKVHLYGDDGKNAKALLTLISDENGKAKFPWNSEFRYIKATKGTDIAMPKGHSYLEESKYNNEQKNVEKMLLLPNHSLYSSGQTVTVKGLAYGYTVDSVYVLPNKEYPVILSLLNREIGKKMVYTNELGAFETEFNLPSNCPNGELEINAGNGRVNIQVEDYKLFGLDVVFDQRETSYKPGCNVEIKGCVRSQSGGELKDLSVEYKVKRTTFGASRFDTDDILGVGEVKVDSDGNFILPILLKENSRDVDNDQIYYRYWIEASVLDVVKHKTHPFVCELSTVKPSSVKDKYHWTDSLFRIREENTRFDATHPGVFYIGTSEKDVYVMMSVVCGGQLLESRGLYLSDETVRFEYPYKDSYGDGLWIDFCLLKDMGYYGAEVELNKRIENTRLATQKDIDEDDSCLLKKENWILNLNFFERGIFEDKVLASMYDASFNQIWSKIQELHSFYRRVIPGLDWDYHWDGMNSFEDWWDNKELDVPEIEYDRLIKPDVIRFIPPVRMKDQRKKRVVRLN